MKKAVKIIIIIILVALAGFFVYKELIHKTPPEADKLEAMKKIIIADPKVNAPNLTQEQINKFLTQFKNAREKVVAANFDTLQGVNELAQLKQFLGDLDGAIITWEYANIIRPKNSLSFSNLAALYHFDLHQYDKAEENYLISIANDPDDIPTIRNLFELYYYALNDNAKAEALLLGSIEQNPKEADFYSLLGSFYSDTGKKEKALEYYQKALERNPSSEAIKKEIEKLEREIK